MTRIEFLIDEKLKARLDKFLKKEGVGRREWFTSLIKQGLKK